MTSEAEPLSQDFLFGRPGTNRVADPRAAIQRFSHYFPVWTPLAAAPEPISERHDVSRFDSGMPSLNTWLQRKARLNEAKGGARTYVVCDGARVIAFYSLAASSVERRRVSSRVGRNMPEPIPVILLGQLAVDTDYQGRGLGSDLLIDAGKRALTAADAPSLKAVRSALEEALGVHFDGEKGARFFHSTLVQTLFYGVFSAWVLWARAGSKSDAGPLFASGYDHASFRNLPLARSSLLHLLRRIEAEIGMARALIGKLADAEHLRLERRADGIEQVRQRPIT